MEGSLAIDIHNLELVCQSVEVLKIPQLTIHEGERVYLHGSNGSGKSSLLRLLCGLYSDYTGQASILSRELASMSWREREHFRSSQIGFVFQHYRLVPYLRAYDNIILPCSFSGSRKQAAIARSGSVDDDAFRLIRRMKLDDPTRLSKTAAQYSAGQQQRFALARALIGQPKLVLLDEPASALDSKGRQAIHQLILEECRENGATLICTSHDQQFIEGFDRTIDMNELNLAREQEVRW